MQDLVLIPESHSIMLHCSNNFFRLCGFDSSFLQGQALQQVQRTQLSPFSLNQTWRMKANLRSNDCLQDTNHMVVMRPSAQENHDNMN